MDAPAEPTWLVLDLDPGPPAGLTEAAQVALHLRRRLDEAGLRSRVKTSGRLGLHLLVPLAGGERFDRTKAYARALAREAARELPDLVIARSVRAERAGRVYVDWIQNDAGRQLVAPYSLRATPVPLVSTPVTWDEVEAAATGSAGSAAAGALRFGPANVLDRVGRMGDLLQEIAPSSIVDAGNWLLPSQRSSS